MFFMVPFLYVGEHPVGEYSDSRYKKMWLMNSADVAKKSEMN